MKGVGVSMDSDAFCFFFGFSTKSLKQRKNVQNKQKIHDLRNEKIGFQKNEIWKMPNII